jgi:hypothetical protein
MTAPFPFPSREEIERLLAEATPDPWTIWAEPTPDKFAAASELLDQVKCTDPFVPTTYMLNGGGKCVAVTGCGEKSGVNARLIAAAPDIARALLAAMDENGRMKEDLDDIKEAIDDVLDDYRLGVLNFPYGVSNAMAKLKAALSPPPSAEG